MQGCNLGISYSSSLLLTIAGIPTAEVTIMAQSTKCLKDWYFSKSPYAQIKHKRKHRKDNISYVLQQAVNNRIYAKTSVPVRKLIHSLFYNSMHFLTHFTFLVDTKHSIVLSPCLPILLWYKAFPTSVISVQSITSP